MFKDTPEAIRNLEDMLDKLYGMIEALLLLESLYSHHDWDGLINSCNKATNELRLALASFDTADPNISASLPAIYQELHDQTEEMLSAAFGRSVPFELDLKIKINETIH